MRSLLILDAENWREGMLSLVLKIGAGLGLLVYIPSMYFAVRAGRTGIATIDTVAIVTVIALHFLRNISVRTRAIVFCLTCYALGAGLLHWVGAISQIYLLAASILAALLLGVRAGLIAVAITTVTFLVMGLTGNVARDMSLSIHRDPNTEWWLITLSFTLISHLVTTAVGVVVSAVDRERNQERETRKTSDRDRLLLRALFDTLPDAVFSKDLEGRYIQANRQAVIESGHGTEEALLGKTAFDLHPQSVAELTQRDDAEVMAGAVISDRELQLTTPDGRTRWYVSRKSPLRDDEGNVTGIVGVIRDITDRRQAERERDRHLRQIELQIERMPIAYILTDNEFNCLRWNPTAERIFGYTQEEMLGQQVFDVIVPERLRERADKIVQRISAGSMDVHGDFTNRTKSGANIACEWHNTPLLDETGKFAGLLSLTLDVTSRKKLEAQLLQSQKMEAIGQLAGGVAHDFNNLLTVIFGYSEMLMVDPNASGSIRSSVTLINEAAQRAAGLTGQLLAFSRKAMLQPKVINVNTVVSDTSTMLRRMIGEDVVLSTVLHKNIDRMRVDPGQLAQVLMNLAVNARDAMPQGGTLTIETHNVELSAEYASTHLDCKPGPHVMLAITDTGMGMLPEVLAHIFEPFYTTKEVGKGTGLGLATVFGIIRQSGGCINVYSEPGIGTTFKLYFPSLSAVSLADGGRDLQTSTGGGETVLLVEDDAAVRRLAAAALSRFGYSVLAAATGAQALQITEERGDTIDVLLTDVIMPGMSGPQLVSVLRDRSPKMKVVFMSGYTDDAVVRHGLLAADVSFLQKPFTPAG
ncbi:MAG: PAS domain S-box protein, partial [Gemmatimonadaceae bacterium]